MKTIIIFAAIAVVTKASLINIDSQWLQFKSDHNKIYKNHVEEQTRFSIFKNNLKKIEEHNKLYEQGLSTFQMGTNEFADLTEDEFKQLMGLNSDVRMGLIADKIYEMPKNSEDLPDNLDWREKGAVTGIKSQGLCGACWAFSATGALEGQTKIKHNKLFSLSEQNLIDCSKEYGNDGCFGGLEKDAFRYVKDHGITTEEKYPYERWNKPCRYNESDSVLKISGYTHIPEGDEKALLSAVAQIGPVSVGIDASTDKFSFYKQGVFDDPACNKTRLTHSVLIIGYGEEKTATSTLKYWLIKNSWDTTWGDKGFMKLIRGKNACGIATDANYPNA